ncbi:MAG: UDP-N-acetylmuramoyl-tripeptide--D-alanyl-D-alanine ligase [Chloroflexi bacterium]|nr:UDP-N-acetylmuramoyl-tripeptide--D-alanyl-D-alanine ligase [Chloroflexota bacterium]
MLQALSNTRPEAPQVITEAVIDSRKAIPGSLFVALPGERADGHDYVDAAFANGASFALVRRAPAAEASQLDLRRPISQADLNALDLPVCLLVDDPLAALQTIARHWRRQLDARVIGITGSVGKSTTKEVVADVLSMKYRTLKNVGNFNNEIGLPLTLLSLSPGHQRAVLEMGFYVPGEIRFLCEIAQPAVGVVSNIGTVHAERAGSQESIAHGKAELVESLPAEGWAILNHDDPLVRAMAGRTPARVLFYGLTPQADLWADEIEGLGLDGIRFRLHHQGQEFHLKVPMLGRHSVQTALRAAAVGLVEGLDWPEIIAGLRFGHMQLRLVAVRAENGALLLDDTYNASPESTLAALNLLAELDGRKVAVLGDMLELGQYEEQGHQLVGRRAAEVADELIAIGRRARVIAAAALDAGLPRERIHRVADSPAAIALLKDRLGPGDVALVKGSRGMKMDVIVPALEGPR